MVFFILVFKECVCYIMCDVCCVCVCVYIQTNSRAGFHLVCYVLNNLIPFPCMLVATETPSQLLLPSNIVTP